MKKKHYSFQVEFFDPSVQSFAVTTDKGIDDAWELALNRCISSGWIQGMQKLSLLDIEE